MKTLAILLLGLFFPGIAVRSVLAQDLPENLGSGVNTACSEINPVLSADGRALYFSRVNYPDSAERRLKSQDIWVSYSDEEGRFTQAVRLQDEINIGRHNAILAAFPDGKTFAVNGVYNRKGNRWLKPGISLIEQQEDGNWGKPEALRIRGYNRRNRGGVANACFAADSMHILLSFSGEAESWQLTLHVAEKGKNGKYGRPKPVKGLINLGRSVEAPFLVNDTILYFSGCFGRDRRNFDIYRSIRMSDDFRTWSVPEPVGDSINTALWQSYYIEDNRGWAYFCSVTDTGTHSDICRVRRKAVTQAENPAE